MRARGPEAVGFRFEGRTEITPPAVRALTRYATREAGTQVRLDSAAAAGLKSSQKKEKRWKCRK
jgi:hypothetical protein